MSIVHAWPWLALLLTTACIPDALLEPVTSPARLDAPPDPRRGEQLMLNHSVLKVGIPLKAVKALDLESLGSTDAVAPLPGRRGINRFLPTGAAGKKLEGVTTIMETCMVCHAGALQGKMVAGLGNSFLDATSNAEPIDAEALAQLKLNPSEKKVLDDWLSYYRGLAPYSRTTSMGTIPALYFTGYFFSHRRPTDFEWQSTPYFPMLETPNPETDIPPLWLLRKKTALYYGGEATGKLERSIMQFMSPPGNTLADLKAKEGDFRDILAWMKQLEPPRFPGSVDEQLAKRGQEVFEESCKKCHGTYGEDWEYNNEVVSLQKVKTDPARADFMNRLPYAQHYNQTWFGETSQLTPTNGYVAPPLDGIWASAPYLHNGSVPTLEALLDPEKRPTYFVRSRNSRDYDLQAVGWKHEVLPYGQAQAPDPTLKRTIYDTTLYGKSNQGHDFGARLTSEERRQVLEYLKTL
ncbi:MAG: hypothetical protein ACKO6N_05180 [Myxococcota bacterium]